jgi:hypothetical protein
MAEDEARDPLVFLPPERSEWKGERQKRPQLKRPSPAGQGARIGPKFAALSEVLKQGRATLADTADDSDPELVAVFDLATTVDLFARAVRDLDGIEFLTDVALDSVEPDEEFYYELDGSRADMKVQHSLYMIMTNARAVDDLVALFKRWQEDPDVKLDHGMNSLKQVFAHLRDLRRWSAEDRIAETGLLAQWQESLAIAGAQHIRAEIELWYRNDEAMRRAAETTVAEAVREEGGRLVASATVGEIGYHGLLVELPRTSAERLVDGGPEELALITADQIMFVAPATQFVVQPEQMEGPAAPAFDTATTGNPVVAVLDGVPLVGHDALRDRIIVDDPDGLEDEYSAAQRRHGTAIASLVCFGDLAAPEDALSNPIYFRPILVPHEHLSGVEQLPADELAIDLLHRAVHRMQLGDGEAAPAAPSVRIVQLAIGDQSRVFDRRMSPMARLLDYLAHEFNLVFVVSAGNHGEPELPLADEENPTLDAQEQWVLSTLFKGRRLRRVFSPGEAINVVTVGAANTDASPPLDLPDDTLQLVQAPDVPTLYSPVGFGFRNSVKPEVLLPGGREVHRIAPVDGGANAVDTRGLGPGLLGAAPGLAGSTSSTAYFSGTSGASALATRQLALILHGLQDLRDRDDADPNLPDPQYAPVLARALLVNAASWQGGEAALRAAIPGINRRELTRILGFGAVDPARCLTASKSRVLLLGAGTASDRDINTFRLPLPPSLERTAEWRELRITLAWLSPVASRTRQYRAARLWFDPPTNNGLGVDRIQADGSLVTNGTVQHEVLHGKRAVVYSDEGDLAIAVNCRIDTGDKKAQVRFGVAVSLEVGPAIRTSVYDEVRELLVQARERVAVQPGS